MSLPLETRGFSRRTEFSGLSHSEQADGLELSFQLVLTQVIELDSGIGQGAQKILGRGKSLIELLHQMFDAEHCVNGVADDCCIPLGNESHVSARNDPMMERDGNLEGLFLGNGPATLSRGLEQSQGAIQGASRLPAVLSLARPIGENSVAEDRKSVV